MIKTDPSPRFHRFTLAGLLTALTAIAVPVTALAIQHGTDATAGSQPWFVQIVAAGEHNDAVQCGGTLITPTRVLTAGHCVPEGTDASELRIVADTDRLSDPRHVVDVRGYSVLPGHAITDRPDGVRAVSRDAAVLELVSPVPDAVPLPLIDTSPAVGQNGRILGRGLTGPQPAGSPDTVQQAGVRVVAPSACQATMADRYDFDQAQSLCVEGMANTAVSTTVPCSGDSGGPLVIGTGPTARLAGIASYLDRRDNCDDPTVRLAAYTDAATIRGWALAPDPVLAPAQVTAPRITGTPSVGSTVSCQSEWTDPRAQLTVDWTIGDRAEDGSLVPIDGAQITDHGQTLEVHRGRTDVSSSARSPRAARVASHSASVRTSRSHRGRSAPDHG